METITKTVSFVVETCITCGTMFGIESDYWKRIKQEHRNFFCPNGHHQFYPQESDKERLERQLRIANQDKDKLGELLKQKEGELVRLNYRVTNGVCPKCNRSFQNLKRHIATKHGDCKHK